MVSSQVFEIVVRRHQAAVRRFLMQLTGDDAMLTDDLAQETFIKAFYAWDTFKALSSAKTWLMRIAYNTFIDYSRARHDTEDLDAIDWDTEYTTASTSEQSALDMDVQQALKNLSPPEQICVRLALIEDRSLHQIADITGMNENTIKSHLHRGKEKLKNYLSSHGYDR